MNRSLFRLILIVVAAAIAGALIMYAIVHPKQAGGHEGDDEEASAPAPQRVTVVNGQSIVTLDVPTQQKIGLATTAVQPAQQAQQRQLFGAVIDVQELVTLDNQAAQARAQAQQARAKDAADRTELGRLRVLNADNKNVSDLAVQQAAATLAADEAAVTSADAALRAALSTVTQRFGPLIAGAVESQSQLYQDLVALRRNLIEMSLPPGTAPPRSLGVTAADGSTVVATLLAPAPRVDPRLQGTTFFYVAPGGKLPAGMNVVAHDSGSQATPGVLVPSAAVVSYQGQSWVYERRDATHFARLEISSAASQPGGFFVTNIPAGTELVTTGAQQLLSEEMRAQLHPD